MDDFYVHTVQVEFYLGVDDNGVDQFSVSTNIIGFLNGGSKLVRDSSGNQILSPAQFTTYPIYASVFNPDCRVTANGVMRRVLSISLNDSGSLNLPDNLEMALI